MKHLGKIALLIASIGTLCVALILFAARLGLWEPITGFRLYRTYCNPLAAIIAGAGLLALAIHLVRREKAQALFGGVAAFIGVALLIPLIASTLNPAPRAAPIHDISTNTVNLPLIEVLDDTRAGARNSLAYGGPELAEAQVTAYPDIAPLETDLSADDVVVVVAPLENGGRVDMRGVSRVGRSDQGGNAARICDFQRRFRE